MHDQKVTNAVCNNNAQCNCPLCGATPTIVIKNAEGKKPLPPVKKQSYRKLGLSQLHFGMRSMENICKMGFNGGFRLYSATKASGNQAKRDLREKRFSAKTRQETGLRLFEVRKDGGTSNTGACLLHICTV